MSTGSEAMLALRLKSLFDAAEVDGFLHAIDIDSTMELGYWPDELVVTASTFKVPVLVELFRQADAGQVDLAEQVTVPVSGRTPGPTGISVMADPVTLSWRDLARWMIVVSDNAATDYICAKVGIDKVNETMRNLGLHSTFLETDCHGIFESIVQDAGIGGLDDFPSAPAPELVARLRAVRPAATDRTVPRDMTRLMVLIYTDQAASPTGCQSMRQILLNQVWPHRFAAGFPESDIVTGGKTGTLIGWRNEVGVALYPDGGRYAVATFTHGHQIREKSPAADAVIGVAARAAVDALRSL
jgi:beta-lactamase class A